MCSNGAWRRCWMARLSDTLPDAERVLVASYRAMPSERKWWLVAEEFCFARRLHAAGLRQRHSGTPDVELLRDWLGPVAPADLESRYRGAIPMPQPLDLLALIAEVSAALTESGIAYAI